MKHGAIFDRRHYCLHLAMQNSSNKQTVVIAGGSTDRHLLTRYDAPVRLCSSPCHTNVCKFDEQYFKKKHLVQNLMFHSYLS